MVKYSVEGSKIEALIDYYAEQKGYSKKSKLVLFTKEYSLNYNQWSAHINGSQVIGTKIISRIIEIFPNINLNWLVKNEGEMFPATTSAEEVTLTDIYSTLKDIQAQINKS